MQAAPEHLQTVSFKILFIYFEQHAQTVFWSTTSSPVVIYQFDLFYSYLGRDKES